MIPTTTIGGYLGAGKTTLINQVLRQADGLRIAVLVNEFGALPIDGDLIETEEDGVISLAGGCICCAFGNDLAGVVADLVARSEPPEHILVEASGVALPGATQSNLSLLPGLEAVGAVVLADVETIQDLAIDKYVGDTILRQLSDAAIVVATKTDLVSSEDCNKALAWLQENAPEASIVPAANGKLPNSVLLGPKPSKQANPSDHHAELEFETVTIKSNGIDPNALLQALSQNPDIIRAKGFFTDPTGNAHLIQVVGKRANISPVSDPPRLGVVCIGPKGRDLAGQLL